MSYIKQINRAIDHIEANLFGSLSVKTAAREAGLSLWHFQRIFAATVGETFADYVAARRLSQGARLLVESDAGVIDIALACEYASHAVFTRAFKRMFKTTPSVFRRTNKNTLLIPQKARVTAPYLKHLYRGMNMKPEITHIDEFSVIGMADHFTPLGSEGTGSPPDNMIVIPKLWQKLRSHLRLLDEGRLGLRAGVVGAAAAPDGKLEYLAGVQMLADMAVPKGFEKRQVPGGSYAKFTHKGPASAVGHTMHYIYGAWLPKSGRQLTEGPEFSLYPPDYDPKSEDGELYIYLPLQ